MISFYPGPSRTHDEIPRYVKDAHAAGLMSINHRSDEFMSICKKTVKLLKQKLRIPKNYTVLFTSSATECWEIIAQSIGHKTFHLYNGAFGQKWFEYTKKLKPEAASFPFDLNEPLNPKKLILSETEGLFCITQNETSNGTQVHPSILKELKKNNPGYLIAVDATSSMAGIKLDFELADIWFASVQKCFGLPAGLGILIDLHTPISVNDFESFKSGYAANGKEYMVGQVELSKLLKWHNEYGAGIILAPGSTFVTRSTKAETKNVTLV